MIYVRIAKKTVFIVFVISDTISLKLFILVVFIHFLISLIKDLEIIKDKEIDKGGTAGMGTIIITFIIGTYAVLKSLLELAINTCLIGLNFSFLMSFVLRFIYKDLEVFFKFSIK